MQKKGHVFKSFVLLIILLSSTLFSQSVEQGNAFNKFMGAEDGINPLSGSVAFKKTLATISSGQASYSIEMNYSGNVQEVVKNRNDIALSGWVGLGWSLGHAKIVADDAGTMWIGDDSYSLQTDAGISFKMVKDGNGKWWIEGLPYWLVEQKTKKVLFKANGIEKEYLIVVGWELTSDAGIKYAYGDMDFTAGENISKQHATEYTIANPYTLGIVGVYENGEASQYPNAWNLSKIEDYNGNYLLFSYEQYMEKVRKNTSTDNEQYVTKVGYTKECYLKSIESSKGESISFITERKNFNREFIDNQGDFEDNSGTFENHNGVFKQPDGTIPDSYMDPMERRFLSQIVFYGNNGEALKYIDFCYEPLDVMIKGKVNQDYVKRLLVSITETSKGGNETKEVFSYIRKELDADNNPLPLGAMDSIIGPNCGVVKYEYKEMTLLDIDKTTGLHKEHVSLSDVSIGRLDDGTTYIVGDGCIYVRTPNGWQLQQDGINGLPLSAIIEDNWFITKQKKDIQGKIFTYYLYVWNGKKWEKKSEYSADSDKNFVEVGPGYLLVAHAADGKLDWQIPWSKWGKSYSGTFNDVSTKPSDRDQIKIMAGKNHFAFYYKESWDLLASGVFNVRSFNSEKDTVETLDKHELDYVEIGLMDDNIFVGINEDGDEAFAYHAVENEEKKFKWKYRRLGELNGWHGTESIQALGKDYFVTKHNDYDNMSLFQYDGISWKDYYHNRDMVHHQDYDPFTEAEWDAIPGYNFFVARQPRIVEHTFGNEIKPFCEYQLYERNDEGEWHFGKLVSSGKEKIIYTGSDWYLVKYDQIGYIRNGLDWNPEDYKKPNSKFMQERDQKLYKTKTYKTKNGDFFTEILVKEGGTDIYYKKYDSFKNPVKGFFVKKKYVKDPVMDKVVSYEYDYVAHSLEKPPTYDFVNKAALVSAYTITLPDHSGIIEKILCDYPNGMARGEICEENYYNSDLSKKPVRSTKRVYERYFGETENWPNQLYMDRLISTTSNANNLTKTEKYNYADGINGLISSVTLYDNNRNKNISEVVDKYAVEQYKELKKTNRLTEKTATYQCAPDCNSGKIVSGSVMTYSFENNTSGGQNTNNKMRATEEWVYAPLKDERIDAATFDLSTSFPSVAWTKVRKNTNYYNGIINETVDQYNTKTATILEKGVVNWNVADVVNAGLNQVLILPGDECNIDNWTSTCTIEPLNGRTFENNNPSAATKYGRFSKAAVLVDNGHKLIGNLKEAKSARYRFSAWVQGTSSGAGHDKLRLFLSSSMEKEFSLKGDGTWEYIEWLSDYDLEKRNYEFMLSAVDNSKIHLQDVRFVPEDALVNVSFYDKIWGTVIAKSDNRSVGSYIEYDDLGRVVETYGETAEGAIVKKSKSTYSSSVCAVSPNHTNALKELVINGENIVVSTTPELVEIAVKNSTDILNISWKSYVDGEKVFYSLHQTGTAPKFEKSTCAGACSITEDFEGNSMTLDIAVSTLDKPYTIKINRSTTGWVDYGKPLTKGYNPVFLSNNNVSGVRYLSEDKIKKAVFNGEWVGYQDEEEDEQEDDENDKHQMSFTSMGGAINSGVDYIYALPNFVGTGDGGAYYYTSDLNALGFKDASQYGNTPSWDNMGSFDKSGVKSDKYHMVSSLDNKTYLLYERTEYIEMPKEDDSKKRKFSNQVSLVVKKLNEGSWVDAGVVALSVEKNNQKELNDNNSFEKHCYPFTDADIAIGKNHVPYVAYIGNVQDYSVTKVLINSNPADDVSDENIPEDLKYNYLDHPAVLIVKHYDIGKNKWTGHDSDNGDILKLPAGIPLPNAKKVKLASDGWNLYMAILYNDGLSSKYALKVYRLIEENSKLKFEEQIDNSFGSAIITYLDEDNHFDIAVHNNKPYVSFVNSANEGYITVVKYDAGFWRSVGTPAFAYVSSLENSADLAVDANGKPYVVLREGAAQNNSRRVNRIVPMKYSPDGDLNLTIKSIGDIPETSLAKDFRQYILNYNAIVPMTAESIPFDITFLENSHVKGVAIKNNGKIVETWKRNPLSRFMMFANKNQAEVPKFDVKLNAGANEIKIVIYGSEKNSSLTYTFNVHREFTYGLDFNVKDMGSEVGQLVLKEVNYVTSSSSSSEETSLNNPYDPGVEFDVSSSSLESYTTIIENYEYIIYPSDEELEYQKMCLEYNSEWFMVINGVWFSRPECVNYDIINGKLVVSSSSSTDEDSSSSTEENQIIFVDDKGNKKIINVVVASSSSSSDEPGELNPPSESSSSDESGSSQDGYIEGTMIPEEYMLMYGYKFAVGTNISFENNVSVVDGTYLAKTVNVAANAQIQGNVQCQENMTISSNAYVRSIALGGLLNTQTGATYGSLEQTTIDIPYIPRKSFDTNVEPLNVWAGQSVTLSPGTYGDVAVYTNASIVFEPGIYYFNSLYIAPDVRVQSQNVNDAIQIWVQNNIRIDDRASFMESNSPKQVFVYGNDFNEMYIGTHSKISASIVYPNGRVNVSPFTVFNGSIWANSINIGANTTIK